jgi:hypothetical protein
MTIPQALPTSATNGVVSLKVVKAVSNVSQWSRHILTLDHVHQSKTEQLVLNTIRCLAADLTQAVSTFS